MKKLLAAVLTVYVIAMSFVLVGGLLQKQAKEAAITSRATHTSRSLAAATTSYTTATIAQHNSESSCWLIINNKVYDVTSFLSEHPGGASTILPFCGKEATHAFDTKDQSGGGHSSEATNLLQDYLIGSLAP